MIPHGTGSGGVCQGRQAEGAAAASAGVGGTEMRSILGGTRDP